MKPPMGDPLGPTEHGEVLTRRWVVDLILDLAGYPMDRDLGSFVAVEPACGVGAFLVGARLIRWPGQSPTLLAHTREFRAPPATRNATWSRRRASANAFAHRTAARPASSRATGTRNGEQDT